MVKYPLTLILIFVFVAGCSPETVLSPIPSFPTVTSSPIPATFTPAPIPPTATLVPSSTPLPGKLVLPVDTLGQTIPWSPDELVESAVNSGDAAERQELYIQAERLLCEQEAALIALYHIDNEQSLAFVFGKMI